MSLTRTLIQVTDDGSILSVDTVEFEGKLWLVPEWLSGPRPNTEMPARIICLHGLPMQPVFAPYEGKADRHLLIPLSRDTLSGGTIQGLAVVERPDMIRSLKPTRIQ